MHSFHSSVLINVVTAALTAVVIVIGMFVFQSPLASVLSNRVAEHISSEHLSDEARTAIREVVTQESQVVESVEQSLPSVVSIVATKEVPVLERYYERSPGIFGFPVPRYRERGTEEQQVSGGTGFFVSADGMIVTNRHVVEDTDASYTVLAKDGEKYEAEVIARDSALDIAVLDIDGSEHPSLSFGDSDALKLGQSVIAIGNALGEFEGSVSTGVVSGLSRSITAGGFTGRPEQLEGVIQTDAAINPGNSGGPLLNLAGEVVGVNVAMAQGSENIGFALPANEVKSIVSSVKETGEIVRPFLGVRYIPVTPEVKERFGLEVDHGVLLIGGADEGLAVTPGSAADDAGLREGDVIVSVNGEELTPDTSLARVIRSLQVGDTVSLEVVRNGEKRTLQATLKKAP